MIVFRCFEGYDLEIMSMNILLTWKILCHGNRSYEKIMVKNSKSFMRRCGDCDREVSFHFIFAWYWISKHARGIFFWIIWSEFLYLLTMFFSFLKYIFSAEKYSKHSQSNRAKIIKIQRFSLYFYWPDYLLHLDFGLVGPFSGDRNRQSRSIISSMEQQSGR